MAKYSSKALCENKPLKRLPLSSTRKTLNIDFKTRIISIEFGQYKLDLCLAALEHRNIPLLADDLLKSEDSSS